MTIIKPSVGRVVWFHEPFVPDTPESPQAAIVTAVHTDRLVNLAVFNDVGEHRGERSITLRQEGDIAPNGKFCEWMPYQHGQAAKAEAAEKALAAAQPPCDNAHVAPGCEQFSEG